jgi:hypothetical protein
LALAMLSVFVRRSNLANEPTNNWQGEVSELLARAAQLCIEHGIDVDPFVRGAYSAYVDARPGMREYLEELQLRATLEQMRDAGRIAEA